MNTFKMPESEWKNIPNFGYVPTFFTICEKCNNRNEWKTTGLWPSAVTCKKCNNIITIPSLSNNFEIVEKSIMAP